MMVVVWQIAYIYYQIFEPKLFVVLLFFVL